MAHRDPKRPQDEAQGDRVLEVDGRAPDPRAGVPKHRARLALYSDGEELSTAERGAATLDRFLEAE